MCCLILLNLLPVKLLRCVSDKHYIVQAQKKVILSAGSVNISQLLQLSGIGDQYLLSSLKILTFVDNLSVGHNLSDHPLVFNIWLANVNISDTFQATESDPILGEKQLQKQMNSHTDLLVSSYKNQQTFLRVTNNFWTNARDPVAGNHLAHYKILFSVYMALILFQQYSTDNFKLQNSVIPRLVSLPPKGSSFSMVTAVMSPLSCMSK